MSCQTRTKTQAQRAANVDEDGLPVLMWGAGYTLRQIKENIALLESSKKAFKGSGRDNPLIVFDGCCNNEMSRKEALEFWKMHLVKKMEMISEQQAQDNKGH